MSNPPKPARKMGLGRGLDALIPTPRPEASGLSSVQSVELERIVPNPHQPRERFAHEALRELAESIRVHGIIQPLVVTQIRSAGERLAGGLPQRSVDGVSLAAAGEPLPRYHLIAGERRWQAARLAGLTTVPVVVREASPQAMLELALIENIQRADLNPLEEAAAYRHLMDDFHLTQEQVAERVGKSRVAVANAVRLLKLPDEIRMALSEGRISEGHARALLRIENVGEQRRLLKKIIDEGLSVRQVEAYGEAESRAPRQRGEAPARTAPRDPQARHLEEEFRRALGTKVTLQRHRSGGGRLIIEFFSEEELEGIHGTIVGPTS
jgi:ParB family transcriptional regulator, chromosome partitioning protein